MKCDVCGSDNLEGAAYCEDCGAKLVVPQPVAVAASGEASAAPAPAPAPTPAPAPAPQAAAGTIACPSCGAENPDSEQYCVDCGANLGGSEAAPAAADEATTSTAEPEPAAAPVVAAAVGRMRLVVRGTEFVLDQERTTIGRRSPADQIEPDIDLTDDDPESYVSRRHAQVLRNEDDSYVYEDVGSSNGSLINNVPCQPGVQQPLKHGDRIRVGKTEFDFTIG